MHSKPDTTVLVVATHQWFVRVMAQRERKMQSRIPFYITHVKTADDFSNKSEQKEGEQVNCLFYSYATPIVNKYHCCRSPVGRGHI